MFVFLPIYMRMHKFFYVSNEIKTTTIKNILPANIYRIIWAIAVLASLCCAVAFIEKGWSFYASHPTLTVIETTHHGIWNYPFPAITICDINRMSYNLTKSFVENLWVLGAFHVCEQKQELFRIIFLPTILIAFFCRKTPANVSKESLIQDMRLMTELIVPGISEFGTNVDFETNLIRLQDIIDDNELSILEVINLVRTKNILSSHTCTMLLRNFRIDKTC